MSSPCRKFLALLAMAPCCLAGQGVLRVCADPNNLPFSSQARDGFENRLAAMLAQDLGMKLEYVWWAQRKNFIENSLNAGRCDALMGVPAEIPSVSVTQPYYRSTYVLVSRRGPVPAISSLWDERLTSLRVGVHVVDNDYAPPAQIFAQRGLSAHLTGFSLFGDAGELNPPARLIEAVSRGEIDIALAWGPLAGYFATDPALEITPVTPQAFRAVPFVYDVAVAVRAGDIKLRNKLSQSLRRQCAAVQSLLREYRVPQLSEVNEPCIAASPVYASSR